MDEMITVLLADDHPALRLGLRVLLDRAPDIQVLGEAATGPEALAQWAALRPAVVVLDCQLPEMDGVAVAQAARQDGLSGRVLALSAYGDERYVRGMLEAGAAGYLLKEEAPSVIVNAVRAAAGGQTWFSQAVAEVATAWRCGQGPAGLTERELEVLRLLSAALSNKEIAERLCVTRRTVDFHVGNILAKLSVESRVEAAVRAKERGLVP